MIDGLTRVRRKNSYVSQVDNIPENIKFAYSSEIFLKYSEFNGEKNEINLLIFSTYTHLDYLKLSKKWYCDGTFRAYPRGFRQIYTIMGDVKGYNFPLVYTIMNEKSMSVM